MRTTITMTEETHEFASYYARARGLTLSAAVDELLRKAQTAEPAKVFEIHRLPNGLPTFPPSGRTVTCEEVNRLAEDEL